MCKGLSKFKIAECLESKEPICNLCKENSPECDCCNKQFKIGEKFFCNHVDHTCKKCSEELFEE